MFQEPTSGHQFVSEPTVDDFGGDKVFGETFRGLRVLRHIQVVQGYVVETRMLMRILTQYVALSYIRGS